MLRAALWLAGAIPVFWAGLTALPGRLAPAEVAAHVAALGVAVLRRATSRWWARPRTGGRPWSWSGRTAPTWRCWTSGCPTSTASTPPRSWTGSGSPRRSWCSPRSPTTPRAGSAHARVAALTDREREVLGLLGAGLSNAEIGRRLHVVEGTVKIYVSTVLGRLGARNRVQAAIVAHDAGLIPPDVP